MLDIYKDLKRTDDIAEYTDWYNVPPLSKVTTLGVDIETTGLNPDNCRITYIGLNLNGVIKTITDEDEEKLLRRFMIFVGRLHEKCEFYLYGHNIFAFDMPFIIQRCDRYKIEGFQFAYRKVDGEKFSREFRIGGTMPIYYYDIRCHGIQIIDTIFLARLNDAKYLFSDHTLKTLAIEIGFRKERRLELSNDEIQECWNTKNLKKLEEYLICDMEDTHALLYKFLSPYHYMRKFLPMTMQEIICSGNAGKLGAMMRVHYPDSYPTKDEKVQYPGGYCNVTPGFYTRVHKFDVSSMYPFIMLNYRLGPGEAKDPDGYFFSILKTLRDRRLEYKKLGKTDPDAKDISEAMKILINSAYGLLGSEARYNNMENAALVCEYGRQIVQKMVQLIEALGGTVVEVDTDGVLFINLEPCFLPQILADLPENIDIEHEFTARWVYCDGAKNYIISTDEKSILKGKFRKRNAMPLMIEFHKTYCEKLYKDKKEAETYYNEIYRQLVTREMDIKKLTVKKTIGKKEKHCLQYGEIGDKIQVYYGYGPSGKPCQVVSGPFHFEYYDAELTEWYAAINGIKPNGHGDDVDNTEQVPLQF